MKRFLCAALSLVMVLTLAACGGGSGSGASSGGASSGGASSGGGDSSGGSDAAAGDTIKVGVFEAMTGGNAAAGELELEGFRLANTIRPTVTIDGVEHPVELVVADNKTDTVEAVTAAASLVSSGCVAAMGGTGSGLCIAAAPTFDEAKIPVVGTTCTNPLVTEGNTYYFRLCYTDPGQGSILATYAKDTLGAKTAAILCDITDAYCIGLAEYFKANFGEENIVEELYFNTGDQDFSAALTTIAAANPDVVFSGSQYTEGALMQVQAEQQGLDLTFLGTDGWETETFLDIGGSAVDGCAFVTFFDADADPTPQSEQYLKDYDSVYGGKPRSSYTAVSYDAYNVLLDAIEACNSVDGETLRDQLYKTSKDCVTGHIEFDDNGDAIKDIAYLKSAKDGQFTFGGIAALSN